MAQVENRSSVPIVLIREGERLTIDYPIAEATLPAASSPAWYLPFMFWLAGAATGLLARPRSTERRLLALGWFGTAIWLAAGYAAFYQANYSNVALHLFLWPSGSGDGVTRGCAQGGAQAAAQAVQAAGAAGRCPGNTRLIRRFGLIA